MVIVGVVIRSVDASVLWLVLRVGSLVSSGVAASAIKKARQ
jgi:hypothetical protein